MCDQETFANHDEHLRRTGALTRREFGVLSAGVGMSMLWPDLARAAEAAGVVGSDVTIETPDGTADAYFVHPESGKHPAVLVWPDAFGLRPAMRQIGQRLASSGYSVLVVNPYYRTRKGPIFEGKADFADPETRDEIMSLMATLDPTTHTTDAKAFVDWLDTRPAVASDRKMGTMGYCMGGPITIRTAAARPDRVGASASFHGGGLVTKDAQSPHLLVPKMKASALIAIASDDDEREPETKDVLREAFERANLQAEIEVYAGALHGWCPPDMPVYDEPQAERAWSRLLVLLEGALSVPAT